MVSEFLLPFGRLNLSFLSELSQKELVDKYGLTVTEAVEIFEFGKNNGGYWTGADLLKQVKEKALPIVQVLYPGYFFLFLFDNATSHSVYGPDALQVKNMGKGSGGKQSFLRDGWFEREGIRQPQPMLFTKPDNILCQKGIQRVLMERRLWPSSGLNLECAKPLCFNCKARATCKLCIKGTRCDVCKTPKIHTGTIECTLIRKRNRCVQYATICRCTPKVHCATCATFKGKCGDCEDLPPKCEFDRMCSMQFYFLIIKC